MLEGSWSFKLCSIKGTPLRIHFSFLLFLSWIVFSTQQAAGWNSAFIEGIFFLSIFLCVLLHELGHVFAARFFSISTKDITLYPFGGIAMLESAPKEKQELLIALAGPAVNVIIALAIWITRLHDMHPLIQSIFEINISLAVFNMIPALPMDGGRVIRSILVMMKVKNATSICTKLSQGCSVLMGIAGIYFGSAMLCIIAGLVFFGALQESFAAHTQSVAIGRFTKDFLIEKDKLYCFNHGTTLSDALPIVMKAIQDHFPVLYHNKLMGLIDRSTLIQTATSDPDDQYLSSFMSREVITTMADRPLLETLTLAAKHQLSIISVVDAEQQFLGFLIPSHVSDFMAVDTIREDQRNFQAQIDPEDLM
jgi:Zn-dependent protease